MTIRDVYTSKLMLSCWLTEAFYLPESYPGLGTNTAIRNMDGLFSLSEMSVLSASAGGCSLTLHVNS